MEKNQKTTIYTEMQEFVERFTYVYEEGLAIEIEDFFQHRKEEKIIKYFFISFDKSNHHYKVEVKVTDFHPAEIRELFFALLRFISYSEATFWAREETSSGMHYLFVSLMKNKTGFCCEIDFNS